MSWAGIDALSASGRGRTLPETQAFIETLPHTTWASGMVLHNTAAPNLSQWTPDNRAQRILNLENYFRYNRGWSSAPHAFVDYDYVWNFTPYTVKGTHSPSWNGTRLGIEMVGNFALNSDDDDTGLGFKIKSNTAALFGMLHTHYGWNPENLKLHKEDPRTDHDCPGSDIDKDEFISMVQEWMGHAGEHTHSPIPNTPVPLPSDPPIPRPFRFGVVAVPLNDTLSLREIPSASGEKRGSVPNGTLLKVFNPDRPDMNGKTPWYHIETPMGHQGFVSAAFVRISY